MRQISTRRPGQKKKEHRIVGKGKWQAIHSQGKTVRLWTTGFYVISEVCESLLNVFEKCNAKLIKKYITF